MAIDIRAILVSQDPGIINVFTDNFRRLGVSTESINDLQQAKNRLSQSKVGAIVVDLDSINSLAPFELLREARSNQQSVLIAIATNSSTRQLAVRQGARFLLQRPVATDQVSQAIHSAYTLMVQERRRYFRVAAVIDVVVRRSSGDRCDCTTINLARNGMAINSPIAFETGESLDIVFHVPASSSTSHARATVVWDDRHGKTGLCFERIDSKSAEQLVTWLDDQYLTQLQPT